MAVQAAHAILAGVWLGGVLFTTLVVSPALTAIKWPETQRVLVRSVIGRHYARLAVANLALLALFALLDGWASGFGAPFYMEYFLLAALFGLVALHGAYFGPRLTGLARAEQKAEAQEEARSFAEKRRTLGRLSARLSWVNLAVSLAVAVLAFVA